MGDLISVITISFNAKSVIEKTIMSVVNQNYPKVEYILIDGGSTDGTIDIINAYSEKISYWISEADGGIYDAMNKGVRRASGDWIIFMNAGDTFYSFDTISHIFKRNFDSKTDIIYGNVNMIYENWEAIQYPIKIDNLKSKMPFSHQAVFVRSRLHKQNLFSLNYKIASDYNFFYTIYKSHGTFLYIDETVANYDAIGGISAKQYLLAKKENLYINGKWTTLPGKIEYVLLFSKISIISFMPSCVYQLIRKLKRKILDRKS